MRVLLFLLLGLFGAANVAAAEPDEPAAEPATQRGVVLVAPGASWRWQVLTAPALVPQLGALAVSGLDVVAGRATAPAAVLGQGAEPARWPYDIDGEPLRAIPAAAAGQRIAAAYGVTTFSLTAGDQGLAMLELRLRYEDGIAAWLNGVEVTREALRSRAPTALADRPHGPEWETFYLPVAPGLLRLGPNVLAIEIHPSARHPVPAVEVELRGRRDRGILRGPVLADVEVSSARIVVDTDPDLEAVLEWGTGTSFDHKERSPAGSHHTFSLTGLPARSQIRYRVHAGVTPPTTYTFHTMPGPGDVIRIGIYGDVRGGHETHRKLVDQMLAEPLDLVGVTGDMVLRGADHADWQRFFAITQPLLAQVRYLPAIGNHDLGARTSRDVLPLPPGPPGRPEGAYWYSYDLADVHLVALDSNAYELVEQATWLEADLVAARARKVRAIIVLTHDGPYSRGYHRGNVDARARYVPILARHHVDLVSGGGGASLYAITCGVRGKPACAVEDGMQASAREHHFLVLTIGATAIELCARRPDGRLLEACTRLPLWRG
jgi:hypothetical protein